MIKAIEPRGAQRGHTFTLRFIGQDLSVGSEVLTTLPASISRLAPRDLKVPESEIPFLVQISGDAAAGVYPLRLKNGGGISNIVLFSVGEYPEVQERRGVPSSPMSGYAIEESKPLIQKITPPVVVNGSLMEAEQDEYSLSAVAGQKLVFEVEARRIGSAIDPVIRVLDASGHQIAYNDDAPLLGSDARVRVTIPKTGEYRVIVRDARFSTPEQNFYRLKIGQFLFAEGVFPLGWQRGKTVDVTLYGGNLPQPASFRPVLDFPAPRPSVFISARAADGSLIEPFPFALSDTPEMLETESHDAAELTPDVIMNGRISKPNERDSYRLKVKPGEKWLIEIDAAALGTSRLNASLSINDKSGKLLAQAVDGTGLFPKSGFSFSTREKGADPKLIFQVPDKTDEILVSLEDLNSGGGADYGYRLRATRQWQDFRLEVATPFINIPLGGSAVVPVRAVRLGYQGPIELGVGNAPAGFAVGGGHIADGSGEGLLTVSAASESPQQSIQLEIWGEAETSSGRIRRRAVGPGLIAAVASEPGMASRAVAARWLGMELPAATSEASPLRFEVAESHIKVVQGLKRELKVRLSSSAPAGFPLKVNARFPSGSSLKAKTATLMPAKDNTWEGVLQLEAEFNTDVARLDAVLEARPDQPGRPSVFTSPAVTVDVVRAYTIQLPSLEVALKAGSSTDIWGKLIREAPFDGEVTIRVDDLPQHATFSPVQLSPSDSEFKAPLKAAPDTEAGEYEVRIVSSGKMEGRKDTAEYNIPDLKLKLIILGAPKTP